MTGIVSYGVHIPRLRLTRKSIVAAHGWSNSALEALAGGERALCNWDEDTLTMSVEAGRRCLDGRSVQLSSVLLASTTFPFADRQNSAVLAEALNLPAGVTTLDVANSRRAGTTALLSALQSRPAPAHQTLVVAADHRLAKAASPQELLYADGAAAVLIGEEAPLARFIGSHSEAVDFVDQYRGTGERFDYEWEDRWVRDEGYLKIVPQTVMSLLRKLDLAPDDIRHFVLPSSARGVAAQVAKRIGFAKEAVADTLMAWCGDTGAAQPIVMLINVLERALPGDRICVVGFGQGCDALIFEVTDGVRNRPAHGTSAARANKAAEDNYSKLATFGGTQAKELGKRAEGDRQTYLSAFYRNRRMLTGFVGGKCRSCGVVQFPKARYCVNPRCEQLDTQEDAPLAEVPGRVVTWTADHLAFDFNPPSYYGLIQFENGARLLMDFTDVGAEGVAVGTPMRVQFRIKHFDAVRGFRRYFWKAVPAAREGSAAP